MMAKTVEQLPPRTILAGTFILSALPIALAVAFPAQFNYVLAPAPYVLFHNIAEFFSILVSLSVFAVVWFTYDKSEDRHALFLSAAFLAIGLMDFMHTLSNAGMPAFLTPNSSNKSTQYWIAVRLFQALAFLASAFIHPETRSRWLAKRVLMVSALALPGLVFAGVTFFPGFVPDTFVPGAGLTPFKIVSEYLVTALLCISAAAYWRRMARTGDRVLGYYVAALILSIFSEINFAVYTRVFDTYNVLGHVYKTAAFALICKGIFIASVREPYRKLAEVSVSRDLLSREMEERKRAEADLQRVARQRQLALDAAHMGWWHYDPITRVSSWDDRYKEIFGVSGYTRPNDEMLAEIIHPEDLPGLWAKMEAALDPVEQQPFAAEYRIHRPDGATRWIEAHGIASFESDGTNRRSTSFVGTVADTTDRKRAEAAQRESEHRERERAVELATLLDAVPTPVFIVHDPDGSHITGNRAADEFLRNPRGAEASLGAPAEARPRHFRAIKDGRELNPDELPAQRAARGVPVQDFEFSLAFDDGTIRHVVGYGTPLRDRDGRPRGAVHILVDITERMRAEERLKASLQEKEVLLKEIHHRVKNNLQVVSSLVSLQADALADPALRGLFADVRDRVRSMAVVHDKLYQSERLAQVQFAEYAQSLLTSLWRAHGAAAADIRLRLDLQPVLLSIEAAVPCGLLLNELAGNALKHAFGGRPGGEVAVALAAAPDGRVTLTVRDDGVGLPTGLDWRQAASLGLRLVQMLTAQLQGTAQVRSGAGGTEFEIAFGGAGGVGGDGTEGPSNG